MKQAYTNTMRRGDSKGPMTIATATKKKGNKQKKQSMPKCTYGRACTRPNCVYRHDHDGGNNKSISSSSSNINNAYGSYHEDPSSKICLPFLAGQCPYGRKCRNRHPTPDEADAVRQTYKSRPCSYGDSCQTDGCLYYHPWEADVDVDLLALTLEPLVPSQPTQSAQGPPEAEGADPTTFSDWMKRGCPLPPRCYEVGQPDPWYDDDTGLRRTNEEVYHVLYPNHTCHTTANTTSNHQHYQPSPPRTGWARVAAATPPSTAPISTLSASSTSFSFNNNAAAAALVGTNIQSATATRNATNATVRMPTELWLPDTSHSNYFHMYPDPMDRFIAVNRHHTTVLKHRKIPLTLSRNEDDITENASAVTLLDVHFQSLHTVTIVLDHFLPPALSSHAEVWIVTGSGHHVGGGQGGHNHQRREEGGVLFQAVRRYLTEWDMPFWIGKDGVGNFGSFLVRGT